MMISESPRNINQLSEQFAMSRPAVSKHIRILRESNLVRIEHDKVDGRQRNCYAQLEALAEVDAYLKKLEAFWEGRLDNLAQFLQRKPKQ